MIDCNCLLFYTLNKIRLIDSPKVSMWPNEDKYAHIPYLRFHFSDTDIDDLLYLKLKETIKSYNGISKWDMIAKKSKIKFNYFILPLAVSDYAFSLGFYPEKLKTVLIDCEYRNMIDNAIKDIPQFVSYIEQEMLL